MKPPEIQYVERPAGDLAFTVFGDGPLDLIFCRPFPINLDLERESPAVERFYRRLSSFARVILFDQPPGGLSGHRLGEDSFTLEAWLDDIVAVLDSVGSERASFVGVEASAGLLAWLAGAHPDRVDRLVMIDPAARYTRAPDYEWGMPPRAMERFIESIANHWGTGEVLRLGSGGRIADPDLIEWYGRLERSCCTPAVIRKIWSGSWLDFDLRGILPAIDSPTLVIVHPEHPWIRPEHGRHIAESMQNARLIEHPGPYLTWWHDDVDATLEQIEAFVSGSNPSPQTADRVLATVLFTDIVGSTERAAEVGDARWRELLDIQESVFDRQLKRFKGRLINTAGDSLLAMFDGPARAIRCGHAIRDDMRAIDVDIRTGVHVGEVELRGEDIGGLAVHVGSRVMNEAQAGEVMVSSIVKDLVSGSGIAFADRGMHTLKGVPGEVRLYSVAST